MENLKIRQNTDKLLKFVNDKFMENELDNTSLVELIELAGGYLNLKTPAEYARANNLSYQGVVKCHRIEVILGVKFVIEND
jgi:hypothetical protein